MSDLFNTLKSTIGLKTTVAELVVSLIQGGDYRTSYDKTLALKALTGPEAAFVAACRRLIKAMEDSNASRIEVEAAKDALKHLIDTMKVLQAQHEQIVNALDGATGLSTEATIGLKAAYAAAGAKATSIFDVEKAKVQARLDNAEEESSSSSSSAEQEKDLLATSVDGLAAIYAKLLGGN